MWRWVTTRLGSRLDSCGGRPWPAGAGRPEENRAPGYQHALCPHSPCTLRGAHPCTLVSTLPRACSTCMLWGERTQPRSVSKVTIKEVFLVAEAQRVQGAGMGGRGRRAWERAYLDGRDAESPRACESRLHSRAPGLGNLRG